MVPRWTEIITVRRALWQAAGRGPGSVGGRRDGEYGGDAPAAHIELAVRKQIWDSKRAGYKAK